MNEASGRLSTNELLALIGRLESGNDTATVENLVASGVSKDIAARLVSSFRAGDTDLFFANFSGQVYDTASRISLERKLKQLDIPGYSALEPMASTLLSDLFKATRELDGGGLQDVVVKIYKLPEKDERLSLFEQERKVLARINHPNTLRLLDTGVCQFGPFLVTEFLDAQPLDVWLAESSRDHSTCSRVVLQVLDATEYLHSRLLLHRDIKASNVMVSENSQVKLIDYGIAGELSHEASGAATMLGAMSFLTASPEQLEGQSADVRSDVYQLGMLICFVHAGAHPFIDTGNPRQLGEDKRLERFAFDSPHWPGTERLDSRLRPILEKAMRWQQNDRYASVGELKEDYQRFVEWREPRYAQKSSGLAARLFIRRHSKWLIPAAVAMLASVIFSAFIYKQYLHIQGISVELSSSLAASNMVTEVFFDAMQEVNPDYASHQSTQQTNQGAARASNIARSALERYSSEIRPDATLDLKVRLGLIQAFIHLSLTTTAFELLETLSLENYEGKVDAFLYQSLALTWIQLLIDTGKISQAGERIEAISGADLSNEQAIDLITSEVRLSQFLGDKRGLENAIARGRLLIVAATEPSFGRWYFYRTSGEALAAFGQYPQAEEIYRLAIRTLDLLDVPENATRRRVVRSGLGNVYLDQGKYALALPIFQSLLALEKDIYIEPHPNLAATYNNLARAQLRSDLVEEALVNMQISVEIYDKSLGKKHTRYLTGRFNYAATLLSAGRVAAAIEMLKKNVAAYASLQPNGLDEAISGLKLAEAHLADDQLEGSLNLFSKYLEILVATLGEVHPRVAVNRCRYARALTQVGDYEMALVIRALAMPVMLETFGTGHPLLKECELSQP